jgi:predicted aspartyl protease
MEIDVVCFNCNKKGHIRRNCPAKMGKKKSVRFARGVKFNNMEGDSSDDEYSAGSSSEDAEAESHNLKAFKNKQRPSQYITRNRNRLLFLPASVQQFEFECLVDSGATHNYLSLAAAQEIGLELLEEKGLSVKMANKRKVKCAGIVKDVQLVLGKEYPCEDDFVVVPGLGHDIILGRPWLHDHNPKINWKTGVISLKKGKKNEDRTGARIAALQEFSLSALQLKRLSRKKETQVFLGFVKMLPGEDEEDVEVVEVEDDSALSDKGSKKMKRLTGKYEEVFPETLPGMPPRREVEHEIRLLDDKPVFKKSYRLSPKELEVLRTQVKELVDLGLIKPSRSPFGAPVLFVKKPDGSLRMVIDYRALNSKTVKDRYPLPLISQLVDKLQKAKYFTKLDLQQGYYQIRMREEDVPKTAFVTPLGSFELLVMPMGQCNSVATFQRLMDTVFPESVFGKFVVVYLDDILVFSETEEEHLAHVEQVLARLKEHQLFAKRGKCHFGKSKITFVGQCIEPGTRSVDPKKAKEVINFTRPTNPGEVRSFYGLVSHCRDFLPGLSNHSAVLTNLTKKNTAFEWKDEHEKAFEAIKKLMSEAITLAIVDEDEPFVLQTDASDLGIGGVLLQKGSPVAVTSRKLNVHELNYPVHEKEMLAVVNAVKKFRHYIEGRPVEVQTDHNSLKFVFTQQLLSRRMTRWMEELAQYDLEIKYLPGGANLFADYLSRHPSELNFVQGEAVTGGSDMNVVSDWPTSVISLFTGEDLPEGMSLESRKFLDEQKQYFEYDEDLGLLYRKLDEELKVPYIPFIARADYVARWHQGQGHVGWEEVYKFVKTRAWWPRMRSDIKDWIQHCPACQVHGRNVMTPQELAHTMPVIQKPFHTWSIDFIGPLPETENGNQWIITAVDHMTRWPVARALKRATHQEVAKFLYEEIVARFGVPSQLVSDRGRNFLALPLENYLKTLMVKHLKTSAYHPRTNGKVESFNGTLGRMLAKSVKGARRKWDEFLDESLLNCRVRKHRVTGFSPFYLVYGVEPQLPGDTTKPFVLNEYIEEDMVEVRARLLESLGADRQAAVERTRMSQDKAKLVYDRFVKDNPLNVGEWVLLRREARLKFMTKWLGPYKVVQSSQFGVYQLAEPNGNLKQDWVHRDRLKKCRIDETNPPLEMWSEEKLEDLEEIFGESHQGENDSDWVTYLNRDAMS